MYCFPTLLTAYSLIIDMRCVNGLNVLIFIVYIGEGIIPATWLNWGRRVSLGLCAFGIDIDFASFTPPGSDPVSKI